MMDSSERPHRTSSNSSSTSELFVCFTSRFSSSTSSTMKISSKSILSPGRTRDPPIALSTSLSRRLRTNGSLKGGQSPMFPTGGGGGKKRGCAFENPEPSSPKVTCIGQVRVKTKKQGKRMRTLSKRRGGGGGGEASFRKIEQNPNQTTQNNHHQYQPQQQQECLPHRNQRWVHLPLTICEALRAFGAEFSCLFPCRSSCFSTGGREKDEKGTRSSEGNGNNNDNNGQSSCGAVFARWLVSLQDGEGGKGREIELVVGGEDDERTESRERTLRRHVVVEEMEIKDDDGKLEERDGGDGKEDQEARVSICIPPKNALLLMRCRSDPMRMEALTNRFWDSPPPKSEEEEEDVDGNDHEVEEEEDEGHDVEGEVLDGGTILEDKEVEASEKFVSTEANEEEEKEENTEPELNSVMGVQEGEERGNPEENLQTNEELQEEEEEEEEEEPGVQEVDFEADAEENKVGDSTSEALADPEKLENEAEALMLIQEIGKEEEEEEIVASHNSSSVKSVDSDSENEETEAVALAEEATLGAGEEDTEEKSAEEKETRERPLEETLIQETEETQKEGEAMESKERESEVEKQQEREKSSGSVLPDCLLLMMCEPKLSMEVSKETWVCSTDFIRWIPERPPVNNAAVDGGDDPKKRLSTDSNPTLPPPPPPPRRYEPPLQQPPRSSCSFPEPAAVSMATMIEQKLVNAVAYEPFVLTRCKSEPMRTAAAKLAPDTCFWKNRKLEPLRRATFGWGAAGVGF